MVLPQPFSTQSPKIASYDYNDIDSGLGYVRYYAFTTTNGATAAYHLTDNAFYSNTTETMSTADTAQTLTFDTTEFTVPRAAKGDAIVSIPFAVYAFRDACSVSCTVALYHYDGTTETQLGSTQTTKTISGDPAGDSWATYAGNSTVKITISETQFAEGDLLRLKVVSTSSGTNDQSIIGHSPNNLEGTHINTTNGADYENLLVDIPFRIE